MKSLSSRPRHGFTLIEVVCVTVVIGLLIALLLAAVQGAREAARRAACTNNMKQIGIALGQHHSTYSQYPAGMKPDGRTPHGRPFAAPSPLSAHTQLLPFLDQAALFNHLNIFSNLTFGRSLPLEGLGPSNRTVGTMALGVFLCPSDWPLRPGNNYRANDGPNPFLHDGGRFPGGGGGVFPGLLATRAQDIMDGLSHTAGFSERLQGGGDGTRFSSSRDVWLSGMIIPDPSRIPDSDAMARTCAGLSSAPSAFMSGVGAYWIVGGYSNTLYNHVSPPNWSSADCSSSDHDADPEGGGVIPGGCLTARSAHWGGVNVLLMDGSVRFVKQSIASPVWRALATRSGGEALSDSSF